MFPDQDDGYMRISDTWLEAEVWDKAVDAATNAIALRKDDTTLWWRRNTALRMGARFEEADTLLDGATDAGVAEEDIACLRIQLRATEGDAVGARKLWEKCEGSGNLDLKRYSEGWLAMAEGDIELAAKRLITSGADEKMSRVAQAMLRLDQGKPEAALNLAEKMLADLEDPPWDAQLVKAQALFALDRGDDAAQALEAGIMADGWAAAHKGVGMTDVVLVARGPDWPGEVAREAAALLIALKVAMGDADAAQALHDEAVKVHGDHDVFAAALEATGEDGDEDDEEDGDAPE